MPWLSSSLAGPLKRQQSPSSLVPPSLLCMRVHKYRQSRWLRHDVRQTCRACPTSIAVPTPPPAIVRMLAQPLRSRPSPGIPSTCRGYSPKNMSSVVFDALNACRHASCSSRCVASCCSFFFWRSASKALAREIFISLWLGIRA